MDKACGRAFKKPFQLHCVAAQLCESVERGLGKCKNTQGRFTPDAAKALKWSEDQHLN
jgi:hypothetical protein